MDYDYFGNVIDYDYIDFSSNVIDYDCVIVIVIMYTITIIDCNYPMSDTYTCINGIQYLEWILQWELKFMDKTNERITIITIVII